MVYALFPRIWVDGCMDRSKEWWIEILKDVLIFQAAGLVVSEGEQRDVKNSFREFNY